MSDVHKFLFAGVFVAVSVTAAAADICKIVKWENTIGVLSGKDLLVTTSEKMNYSISSFQVDKKVYMYAAGFSCYEQGVKEPCRESNTPEGKCTELRADARDGKIFWQVKYQWRNMDVVRTIETGDFPGFKLTYDFEVTRDFQPRRIYLNSACRPGIFTPVPAI